MKRLGLPLAAALVVLANAFVLGGVALNRAVGPRTSLALSPRELPVVHASDAAESSGVALRLDTSHYQFWGAGTGPERDTVDDWLTEVKLASLGFDVAAMRADVLDGSDKWQPDRRAYAFVAFGGPVLDRFRERLRQQLAAASGYDREQLERELRSGSRLFIVDADRDPGALRARHADPGSGFILPASIAAHAERLPGGQARVRGWVALKIEEVNVPHRFHAALAPARRAARTRAGPAELAAAEGYEVVLGVGSRFEPWIVELRAARPASR